MKNPLNDSVISVHELPEGLITKVSPYNTNGTVTVENIISAFENTRKKNKNKRHMLFVMFGFMVCFVLVNMGLTYTVVKMTRDMRITNGGQLVQTGTNLPVSTSSMKTVDSIHSESSLKELSQLSHLMFSSGNDTQISLEVQGFSRFNCTEEITTCDPQYQHVLMVLTPDAIVAYHGPDFVLTNVSSRMDAIIELSGISKTFKTGRHLLFTWKQLAVAAGGGALTGAATGAMAGGVGAGPGAFSGALIGMGVYLINDMFK